MPSRIAIKKSCRKKFVMYFWNPKIGYLNNSTVKAPLTDNSYERTALSNGQFFGHRCNSYRFVKKLISIERTLC
jgi:hypothetical protein